MEERSPTRHEGDRGSSHTREKWVILLQGGKEEALATGTAAEPIMDDNSVRERRAMKGTKTPTQASAVGACCERARSHHHVKGNPTVKRWRQSK